LHQQLSDELAGREDFWMMKNLVMIDPARRTADQDRQFELNTFWDAQPMQ